MEPWTRSIFAALVACLIAPAAQGKRPNILLAVADDMSHASAYGYEFLETPSFDSLAAEGLLFDRMYTPSSKCAPSRAVILTGRNPWQLGAAANHQPVWPEKYRSFVERLADAGYLTGYTGKGWDPGIHPKGRNLTGTEYNQLEMDDRPSKHIARHDYAGNFREFLADREDGQPFFFWYGCREPHRGYEFGSGVKAGKSLEDLDFSPEFWPTTDPVKHDILDYALEVEYFDSHLGKILAHLEEAGELENTLIVATSDNSMPFPRYKGHPHEYSTRVPFALKWQGKIARPGRRCPEFASFIDLAPTFLEAAGVAQSAGGMPPIQGKSLSDFFGGAVTGRDHVFTGRERNDMCRPNCWGYPVRSYHRGDFVYMHNFEPDRWPSGTEEAGYRDTDWGPTKSQIVFGAGGTPAFEYCFGKRPREELYDIVQDPGCVKNLALDPAFAGRCEEMKERLFTGLTMQADPRVLGEGEVFDRARPERAESYGKLVLERAQKSSRSRD